MSLHLLHGFSDLRLAPTSSFLSYSEEAKDQQQHPRRDRKRRSD